MSDSIIDRLSRAAVKPAGSPAISALPDCEELEDYGAFGWLREARDKAIMLELRKRDGNVRAIGYAWLQEVHLDPSREITLCIPGGKINIIGRNLNAESKPNIRLFQGITRHKVAFIQEADEVMIMKSGDSDTFIGRIEW